MHRRFVKSPTRSDINFALKCAWEKIDQLGKEIELLKSAASEGASAPVPEFDWKTSKDKDALEVYGRTIGIELKKSKSAENMRKDIKAKLNGGDNNV